MKKVWRDVGVQGMRKTQRSWLGPQESFAFDLSPREKLPTLRDELKTAKI